MEWFATAIADRCSFYLCLANGAMFYHQMIEGGSFEYSDYDESAKYFSNCTGLLAQRLGHRQDGVSEGVITTVLGFLCHDVSVEALLTSGTQRKLTRTYRLPWGSGIDGRYI